VRENSRLTELKERSGETVYACCTVHGIE
jgi:hypothetical protein